MRKLFLMLLIIPILISCQKSSSDEEKIVVTALNFPCYDAARAVIRDSADLEMLIPPGSEVHDWEPSPDDVIRIMESDLFIYVGGESDEWLDGLLSDLDESVRLFSLIEHSPVVFDEETVEGMQSTEHEEKDHSHIMSTRDEHVWTSLENMASIVSGIRDEMAAIDPLNEASYRANADSYVSELNDIRDDYERMIENSDRRLIVVADRFPFLYLVREFGLDYYAAFPSCASGSEPSARTISFLIDKVKEKGIPVVFHIELSNTLIAELVADETGANVRELNSAQNISRMDFNDGLTYLDIMRGNLSVLEEALN